MTHTYLHIDLDAFFASVEQLDNPEFRGKPVIVGGLPEDRRSVVSTCSYEARKYGVHSAMPTAKAKQLCPDGIFVRGRMKRYHEKSAEVMSIFREYSPDVLQMSVDEAFVDLTGTEMLFGPPEETARRIKRQVKEKTGLTVSIGLSASRYIAKIASGVSKPDGFYCVPEGQEEAFMLSLPLDKLWGAGSKTRERLNSYGYYTMQDIHNASLSALSALFGEHSAEFLYNAVRGIGIDTFGAEAKNHSISAETTFPYDLTDFYIIETELMELSYDVFFRLLRENRNGKTVQVKIRYEDFSTVSVSYTYDRSISTTDDLFEKACSLLRKKYEPGRGIRLLGIAVQNVENGMEDAQGELFDFGENRKKAVEKALLSMQKKDSSIHVRKARQFIINK